MEALSIKNIESNLSDNKRQREAVTRGAISKISREELEDRYLRLHEENLILKKHGTKQEEKIKKMATKLLRLAADRKKAEAAAGIKYSPDAEEAMEDLRSKIRSLEKQNDNLKKKMIMMKQEFESRPKSVGQFSSVKSRINTNLKGEKTITLQDGNAQIPGIWTQGEGTKTAGKLPKGSKSPRGPGGKSGSRQSMLEELRHDNRTLSELVDQLRQQTSFLENESMALKETIKEKEMEYETALDNIRQQLSSTKRANIQENVELIRLQREVKDKATQLQAVQAQYENLKETMTKFKGSYDTNNTEIENLQAMILERNKKNEELQADLEKQKIINERLDEYRDQIMELEAEKQILKEANEKIIKSTFGGERELEHQREINGYKVKLAEIETTLKVDLSEKGEYMEKLKQERETNRFLNEHCNELQSMFLELKEKHEDLSGKMEFFTKESAVDINELEEALALIKMRKEKENIEDTEFNIRAKEEELKALKRELLEVRAVYCETVSELEKTRNMLSMQHQINKEYKNEVDSVNKRFAIDKEEFNAKLKEYADLLDIRAARIKKLEAQLRDIAYGTKQYKLEANKEEDEYEDTTEVVELERGENIFEFHVAKMVLSDEAQAVFDDAEPITFITIEFYEFEIQATPIVRGYRPEFNSTSQYVVRVDDFFLRYLQKESATLELHRAFGTDYRTVAACQVTFSEILEHGEGRIRGTAQLVGIDGSSTGFKFASIEFWYRLRVPMEHALRLYKERTKAIGYVASNITANKSQTFKESKIPEIRQPSTQEDYNELNVRIVRCTNLRTRRGDVQPSPYCVYKFYEFDDHDTTIISNSNSPEFSDVRNFCLNVDADLDAYLKTGTLDIYVFDDSDPEDAAYLGVAKIPLLPLTHDNPIQGVFELTTGDNLSNGNIEIVIRWMYTYLPATEPSKMATKTPSKRTVPVESSIPIRQPSASSTPGYHLAAMKNNLSGPIPMKSLDDGQDKTLLQEVPIENLRSSAQPSISLAEAKLSEPKRRSASSTTSHQANIVHSAPEAEETPHVDSNADDEILKSKLVNELKKTPPLLQRKSSGSIRLLTQQPVIKEAELEEDIDDEQQEGSAVPMPKPTPQPAQVETVNRKMSNDEEELEDDDDEENFDSDSTVTGEKDAVMKRRESQDLKSKSDKDIYHDEAAKAEDTIFGDEEVEEEDIEDEDVEEEEEEEDDETSDEDVVLPGSRRKSVPKSKSQELIEVKHEEEISDEEESDINSQRAKIVTPQEEESSITEDSEDQLIVSPMATINRSTSLPLDPRITITLSSLLFHDNEAGQAVLDNPSVKAVFIEYKFLDIDSAETETPVSLPKGTAYQPISFNFRNVFYFNKQKDASRRALLREMLNPDHETQGRLWFTVVSDPSDDDEEQECADVGYAYVDLVAILENEEDVINRDVDVMNSECDVLGTITVTVEALDALISVTKEGKKSKKTKKGKR
ncbi:Protein fantom [Trichoplax sp. H2]|nr:Protein fantom [Trichoplax sp. H2]|eukprot:RDD43076.1 Protein fantom [Trichoplax sp. H2]